MALTVIVMPDGQYTLGVNVFAGERYLFNQKDMPTVRLSTARNPTMSLKVAYSEALIDSGDYVTIRPGSIGLEKSTLAAGESQPIYFEPDEDGVVELTITYAKLRGQR